MRSWQKKVIILVIFGLCIIALRWGLVRHYFTIDYLQTHYVYLQQIIQRHYFGASALFIIGSTIVIACGIPVFPLITVGAGALFGFWQGALLAIVSATAGALIAFLICRYLLMDIVQRRYAHRLQVFNNSVSQQGALYLLFLQLLPITPFSVIISLAGISVVSLWTFCWTTFVGIMPGAFIYAFAGRQFVVNLEDKTYTIPTSMYYLLLLLAFIAFVPIAMRWIRHYVNNKKEENNAA